MIISVLIISKILIFKKKIIYVLLIMDIIIIIILKLVNYEFVKKDLIMNIKNIGKFFEDCMK